MSEKPQCPTCNEELEQMEDWCISISKGTRTAKFKCLKCNQYYKVTDNIDSITAGGMS